MQLVIASRNVHKIREMRSMLKGLTYLDLYSLIDFPQYVPPSEEGSTFQEIAFKKALHAAKTLNKWVIADDSGLVVPALDGAPGIFSARYAGENATDADRRRKLLHEMRDLKEQQRAAYFECCLVLASPQGETKSARGLSEGVITTEERGSKGFGYDPIFMKYDYSKTFGELEADIKIRISHRRKALDKLILVLETLKDSE